MPRLLNSGDWRPGAHNLALLIVQVIFLWQAWLRGRAYLKMGPPPTSGPGSGLTVAETSVPGGLPTWGALLLVSVTLVIIGLAAHRAPPIVVGHALLGGWYLGLGVAVLRAIGIDLDALTIVGLLVSLAATWVMFRPDGPHPVHGLRWWAPWRRIPPLSPGIRLLVGGPGLILGQELLVGGLAEAYQGGTGLVSAGLVHLTLAGGTWVLWNRQRLESVAATIVRENGGR